jgi:2-iminobutanoate/2-iminopropanoate deaminase
MAAQAEQALKNLSAVLDAAGLAITHIAKTTVFISDMNMFGELNQVYSDFMGTHKPARACVQVARLPKDVLLEIEAIAVCE